MRALPTGTVTFLLSDIEGSTRLLQRVGGERYAEQLGQHQVLLRAAWAAHGGVEIDTEGDSFFVAFPSAPQAVAAGAQATRALAAHPWPEGAAIRVRIGLHTGAPALAGDTYIGLDVHRAARIAAAGHGGQILLSEATRALAEPDLPEDALLLDLGEFRLKDLQRPEHLYQLVLDGLPGDFPPLKTLDRHAHNLPVQPTPLLGRDQALAAVCALLRRDDVHLVTLTGPGGIGKTRLSVQVAAEVLDDVADGVWFVRLSRLTDPTLVVPTVAQTLGLREQGSQPIAETLREYLRDRRLLLVLDNFEQVVGAAPEVAGLLGAALNLKVLVTSRVALHLRGEREQPLAPLPLPDPGHLPPPERLSQYAAVALLVERAQAARPGFAVTAANAPAIAEICARLDGLPLAIELAAARIKLLPPEALLARLSSRLKLLTGGPRDLEERQQTMRATIAWSEGLLTAEERVLFRRLSLFVGGCTLEAAEAVCAAPEGAEPLGIEVLEGLGALVDQSLVQQREEGSEPRFGMLHVIREYALEQLQASGEAEVLRRAHFAHYLGLAERAEPELVASQAGEWYARLEREHDNLRVALGWAREREEAEKGLRLAAALGRFWTERGHFGEGRTWFETLLAIATRDGGTDDASVAVRVQAHDWAAWLALWQGDNGPSKAHLEQSLALARQTGDPHMEAQVLNSLGAQAVNEGDLDGAAARFAESLEVARRAGDRRGCAVAQDNLGLVAYYRGDLRAAEAFNEEAIISGRERGDRASLTLGLFLAGSIARKMGDVDRARALLREALELQWELGTRWFLPDTLEMLAAATGASGREHATRLLGAAAALREAHGTPLNALGRADTEQAVAEVRAALGEEGWAAAFAAGKALSLEEAIAEALETEQEQMLHHRDEHRNDMR